MRKKRNKAGVVEMSIFDSDTPQAFAEYVQYEHHRIGHLGWDATWRVISESYYGILRADVIFLLKRCLVCATNPAKRPKGSTQASSS